MSSEPDIVILMMGGKESINVENFTPEEFVNGYSGFISTLQNMTSKPNIMLISPIYSAATVFSSKQPFKLNSMDTQ